MGNEGTGKCDNDVALRAVAILLKHEWILRAAGRKQATVVIGTVRETPSTPQAASGVGGEAETEAVQQQRAEQRELMEVGGCGSERSPRREAGALDEMRGSEQQQTSGPGLRSACLPVPSWPGSSGTRARPLCLHLHMHMTPQQPSCLLLPLSLSQPALAGPRRERPPCSAARQLDRSTCTTWMGTADSTRYLLRSRAAGCG